MCTIKNSFRTLTVQYFYTENKPHLELRGPLWSLRLCYFFQAFAPMLSWAVYVHCLLIFSCNMWNTKTSSRIKLQAWTPHWNSVSILIRFFQQLHDCKNLCRNGLCVFIESWYCTWVVTCF